ncbi:hypothetical protein [Streptomyces sp. NBC_00648]|uniref:hypothetical protein n=1 Tax=Streptomyces sp. NBC_00648 TaxID=2975797 RepID=UPI003246FEC4
MLRTPGYLGALVLCALIGIPVSLAAFWFMVGLHELEHVLWAGLPHTLGRDVPPWWWPLPLLLFAGAVVGLVATRLPGAGGHVPAAGLHVGGASSAVLPGVLLAAAACLPFGAVLGPEAPLIALGGGLALWFRYVDGRTLVRTIGCALGAAAGVLLAPLPGLGVVPGMAAGMAAATAGVLRLPVSSVVLVVLLLGSSAMMPVVTLAAVVAFVTVELLPTR